MSTGIPSLPFWGWREREEYYHSWYTTPHLDTGTTRMGRGSYWSL